jgi:hypothetical protein
MKRNSKKHINRIVRKSNGIMDYLAKEDDPIPALAVALGEVLRRRAEYVELVDVIDDLDIVYDEIRKDLWKFYDVKSNVVQLNRARKVR